MENIKQLIGKRVETIKTSLTANRDALSRLREEVSKTTKYIKGLEDELAEYKQVWELIENNE